MARIAADITWLIGRTPLVQLGRLAPPGVRLLAKLEAQNPTGSNKARAALAMIAHAERSGFLTAGGTVVECSGGDLGLAIAMVGRRRGYRVVLTMPENLCREQAAMAAVFGAEIVKTPAAEGMRGAMVATDRITRQTPGAVCLQAFTNRANAWIHQETTAREIWEDTDGDVDFVVVPVGTGGTAAGCAAFFREQGKARIVAVEPDGSPVLSGGKPGPHDIPGLGAGFVPDILAVSDLDEVIRVTDADAALAVQLLAQQEAMLVGPASGAVLHGALVLARRPENSGHTIAAVLPDSVERYLDWRAFRGDGGA